VVKVSNDGRGKEEKRNKGKEGKRYEEGFGVLKIKWFMRTDLKQSC